MLWTRAVRLKSASIIAFVLPPAGARGAHARTGTRARDYSESGLGPIGTDRRLEACPCQDPARKLTRALSVAT